MGTLHSYVCCFYASKPLRTGTPGIMSIGDREDVHTESLVGLDFGEVCNSPTNWVNRRHCSRFENGDMNTTVLSTLVHTWRDRPSSLPRLRAITIQDAQARLLFPDDTQMSLCETLCERVRSFNLVPIHLTIRGAVLAQLEGLKRFETCSGVSSTFVVI